MIYEIIGWFGFWGLAVIFSAIAVVAGKAKHDGIAVNDIPNEWIGALLIVLGVFYTFVVFVLASASHLLFSLVKG